jgi:hypothetical protein
MFVGTKGRSSDLLVIRLILEGRPGLRLDTFPAMREYLVKKGVTAEMIQSRLTYLGVNSGHVIGS